MKRFAIAATAALMMASPVAATSASAQEGSFGRGGLLNSRDNDRGRDNRDNDRGRDNRDNDRDNRGNRWNQREHNGYYLNGRWNYGPPPASVVSRRDYRPGYNRWRRGDRLPAYYRSHYRQIDWRRERLRQPPRGYHYVRDDRGEVLLVGIATGVILSILLSN